MFFSFFQTGIPVHCQPKECSLIPFADEICLFSSLCVYWGKLLETFLNSAFLPFFLRILHFFFKKVWNVIFLLYICALF